YSPDPRRGGPFLGRATRNSWKIEVFRLSGATGQGGTAQEPDREIATGRGDLPWHRRLRRHGPSAIAERVVVGTGLDHARRTRPGEIAHSAFVGLATRRMDPDPRRRRDSRKSVRAHISARKTTRRRERRRGTDPLVASRRSLRREARDARHHDC